LRGHPATQTPKLTLGQNSVIPEKREGRKQGRPQAYAKYIYIIFKAAKGRKQGSRPQNICIYIHAPRPQAGARTRPQASTHPITLGRGESLSNQTLDPLWEGWVRLTPQNTHDFITFSN